MFVFGARGVRHDNGEVFNTTFQCKPPNFLIIELNISYGKSHLFELRLKLRQSPQISFFQRIQDDFSNKVDRSCIYARKIFFLQTFYTVKMAEDDDHKGIVDFLGDCAGGRVGKAAINCEDEKFLAAADLLKGLKFGIFFVNTRPLTDTAV